MAKKSGRGKGYIETPKFIGTDKFRIKKEMYQEYIKIAKRANAKRGYLEKSNPDFLTLEQNLHTKELKKTPHFKPSSIKMGLNNFKSKAEFLASFERAKKYADKDFVKNRTNQYRDSMKKAIKNVLGNNKQTREIIKKLNNLTPKQLQEAILKNPNYFNISYIYYDKTDKKLNELNDVLGRYGKTPKTKK